MNCNDMQTQAVCLRREDGSKLSAIAHYEYGLAVSQVTLASATRFTDATGILLYNPADFAEVTVGACPLETQCVDSQEWTYGIDNTGTRFNDVATYCLELSDGSTLEWSQDGSSTSWTPQLIEWSGNIQAAADAAGLKWFVEPRFVDNPNPSNIDGTINGPGGNPSGLPGAPSVPIAEALVDGGMQWRYVNFQICPGQPVPTRAYRKTSALYGDSIYDLTAAGAVLGPVQKFWVCTECGREPVWYLEDGITLANEGQIPNCWEPCGTLALTESPPDRACEFFFVTACDNQNDTDPTSFIQDITRRTTVCNGEITAVDYLQADPGDPTVLEPYDLIGAFVDCASGIPVEEELPPCEDFEYIGNLYKFVPQGEVGTLIEWWKDVADGGNSAPHDAPGNIFTLQGGTYVHPNGAPTASYLSPTFSTSTSSAAFVAGMGQASNADTSGTDQLKLSGYINMPRAGVVSDTNPNTGERGLFGIQYCCQGELVTLAERTTDSVSGDTGIFTNVELPAGIHYVEILTSDLSAWQGMQFSLSLDGGATTQPFESSTGKPYFDCIPVIKCKDSGALFNAETGELVEVEFNDSWCEPSCNIPVSDTGTSSGTSGPTAQEIAEAMVTEERSRISGRMESWQNEGGTVSLNVPAGTMGCIKTITDYGTGAVYWTLDGSTPSSANGSTMSVQYGNTVDICGVDLSLVRLDGSNSASDFSITYEVWS